ncbi:MAG: transglycosylase domain-containing protein [Rhodothermales bacterium]|nr:transglycosylase domain-containing protein [Rhodothermales bacterium]
MAHHPSNAGDTPLPERLRAWLAARADALRAFPYATRDHLRARLASNDRRERAGAIGGLALAGLMTLVLAGWLVLLFFFIPDPASISRENFDQATVVFTADGEELTRYAVENRVWMPLDSISPHVTEALLATEDHRFYRHGGIDLRRLVGAARATVGGNRQGGSTITMQLARNAYPQIWDDATPIRKLRELLTAKRLEDHFSKDEILEMYLNTVSFIYQAFGIEAAAQTYFAKPAQDLTALEGAVLVGMLKGPVYYNPVRNPERSRERRDVILAQMVKFGYLDAATADSLRQQETPLDFRPPSRDGGIAPHFAEHVRRHLDEWAERRGYNLYTDGLVVHTTIDSRLQAAAQQAAVEIGEDLQAVANLEWSRSSPSYFSSNARDYRGRAGDAAFAHFWAQNPDLLNRFLSQTEAFRRMKANGLAPDSALARLRADAAFVDSVKAMQTWLDVGFVALDPRNGQVRAWVGGRDFAHHQYDHVAQARRQPGSTFKPFVYTAALERGFRPTDQMPDSIVTYRDPGSGRTWRPANVGGGASGRFMTLADALAYSKNTITAQLVAEVGPQRVAQTARRMGIKSELDAVPSIGLGTSPVTLLEMAGAYTPLANQGRYAEPVFLTRIENRDGQVIATFSSAPRPVLERYTAYSVLDMMRGVVDRGTGVRIRNQYGARGDFAGKTGTTQNGADGWFMLMHPELVMGAVVGFTTPSIHFRSNYWGQGAHTALHVIGRFYREAGREVLASDARFEAPVGWEPPPPPDTLSDSVLFADDFGYDDTLAREADSLLAATDSLLYRFDRELEGRDGDRAQARRDSVAEAAKTPSRRAADSLNAMELRKPLRTRPDTARSVSAPSIPDSLRSLPPR